MPRPSVGATPMLLINLVSQWRTIECNVKLSKGDNSSWVAPYLAVQWWLVVHKSLRCQNEWFFSNSLCHSFLRWWKLMSRLPSCSGALFWKWSSTLMRWGMSSRWLLAEDKAVLSTLGPWRACNEVQWVKGTGSVEWCILPDAGKDFALASWDQMLLFGLSQVTGICTVSILAIFTFKYSQSELQNVDQEKRAIYLWLFPNYSRTTISKEVVCKLIIASVVSMDSVCVSALNVQDLKKEMVLLIECIHHLR